ncbi:hypothetical protein NPM06_22395, partial [Bacillus cereus]|nr:hypothetical protein [Bacillus cereus]
MVIQFLRENKAVSFVLAVIRVYLGYTWLMAGIGKLQGKGFDATGYLQGAIEKSKNLSRIFLIKLPHLPISNFAYCFQV